MSEPPAEAGGIEGAEVEALEFEWDPKKAVSNLRKHGVAFEEATTVFGDASARIFDDEDHSTSEMREIIIGLSNEFRLLVVSFTERPPRIRIIGARRATRSGRQEYEEKPH